MEIDLKTDSRKVKPGDTFIAIRNVNRDGHDYIPQAIKNGATKVIVEEGNYDVETVVRASQAHLGERSSPCPRRRESRQHQYYL